jgi:hypothetical protein
LKKRLHQASSAPFSACDGDLPLSGYLVFRIDGGLLSRKHVSQREISTVGAARSLQSAHE